MSTGLTAVEGDYVFEVTSPLKTIRLTKSFEADDPLDIPIFEAMDETEYTVKIFNPDGDVVEDGAGFDCFKYFAKLSATQAL